MFVHTALGGLAAAAAPGVHVQGVRIDFLAPTEPKGTMRFVVILVAVAGALAGILATGQEHPVRADADLDVALFI